MNVCPSCGTSNPVSAKFCQECGTRLTPSEAIGTASSPNEPEQPSAATTDDTTDAGEESAGGEPEPSESPDAELDESSEPARPKKDVSGLPPSWMPAPVTLSARPSGQRPIPASPPSPPPVTTTPAPLAPVSTEPSHADDPSADSESTSENVTGLPPAWMPPPVDLGAPRPVERSGVDADWKMSDAGPLPDRRDRRLWLWIPVGLIAAVLVCCIAFFIWATTIGEDTVDGWATNAAVNQTEETTSGD